MNKQIKQLTTLALLSAFMLIFGYFEKLFPLVPALPAVKLGLSNVILLFALTLLDSKSAWILLFIKVLLGGILYMGPIGTLLAAAGSLASILVMSPMIRHRSMSLIGIGVAGSVAHMVAQMLVQSFLIGTLPVLGYAPVLLVSSLLSGIFIAYLARMVLLHMSKIDAEYRNKLNRIGVIEDGKQEDK